jgi:3-deoxy-D-arabino-heptulosonate 7-phosphate (DAHP) synthase
MINDGLRIGRKLLLALNDLGMPAGVEYLDMISPQYIADLVSWGAIGARTTRARCIASWLPAFPAPLDSRMEPTGI